MMAKRLFLILLVFITIVSCRTTKIEYVDREVVKYETKIQHDTVSNDVHDSIYISVLQKGDTVYSTKYVERIKYKYQNVVKIDTCYRDSIRTEYKEIVKEKAYIPKFFWFCFAISIIVIIFAAYKLYNKVKWLH